MSEPIGETITVTTDLTNKSVFSECEQRNVGKGFRRFTEGPALVGSILVIVVLSVVLYFTYKSSGANPMFIGLLVLCLSCVSSAINSALVFLPFEDCGGDTTTVPPS